MDFPKFKTPCSIIVAGGSQTGKTELVIKILQNLHHVFMGEFSEIIWAYSSYQQCYEKIPGAQFCHGLPDMEKLRGAPTASKLLILDDLLSSLSKTPELIDLFTHDVHHNNITVIFIVQNLYFNGIRNSRINCQGIILMKSVGDKLTVQTLARQLYPGCSQFFLKAYSDATKLPYTYLLIDLSMHTPDQLRLRTNILPDQWPMVAYVPQSL